VLELAVLRSGIDQSTARLIDEYKERLSTVRELHVKLLGIHAKFRKKGG
jgi:hypothetical protein